MPNSPHVLRTRKDQLVTWEYDVTEDHGSDDIVFYVEKTEPRGHDAVVETQEETLTEVHREPAPSAGTTITVTVDPIDLGLESNVRYERAVKRDDGNNEYMLDDGLLFVLRQTVTTS